MAQLLAQKANAARPAVQQSRHGVQSGGFARTVGTDQRHHLPRLHMEGYILHCVDTAVVYINIFYLQHTAHDAASFRLPK